MSFASRAGTTQEQKSASINVSPPDPSHKRQRSSSPACSKEALRERHRSSDSNAATKWSKEPLDNAAPQPGSRKKRKIFGEDAGEPETTRRENEWSPTLVPQNRTQRVPSESVEAMDDAQTKQPTFSCALPPRPSIGTTSRLNASRRPKDAEARRIADVDSASSRLKALGLESKTSTNSKCTACCQL